MKSASLILTLLLVHEVFASGPVNYSAAQIPDSLKSDANVVVRLDETTFTILNEKSAVQKGHEVYTILNVQGSEWAEKVLFYSKLIKVKSFNGNLYNKDGELVKKIKQSEIYDQSAVSGYSLYEDNRLKVADLKYGSYPYTVEFTYELEYDFLFYIPTFQVQPQPKVAVENSSFVIEWDAKLTPPRYKEINMPVMARAESNTGSRPSLSWKLAHLPAYKQEPFGPMAHEISPQVLLAPSSFEFEGYYGRMEDWDRFGLWINSLGKNRLNLSAETVAKARELTASASSITEKIDILYKYMQSRTRYVSIQIGIGGYQPFDAATVDRVGYGDCKALSNYMVALLEAVGIPSNYTLIRAGQHAPKMVTDFPSTQFNHAVVMVPIEQDTVWLECTSQVNPFGYSGTFTGDREALAVTKEGAKVVPTPVYPKEVNLQKREAIVSLEDNGDAIAVVKTTYAGLQYENNGLYYIQHTGKDKLQKWVTENTEIGHFAVKSVEAVDHPDRIPSLDLTLELELKAYATRSGKRLFITPNLMNRSKTVVPTNDKRKHDIYIRDTWTDVDSVVYLVPDGMYPEFLPEPVTVTSPFGTYRSQVKMDDQGNLIYVRRLDANKGVFPAASYPELKQFFDQVQKHDARKLVFLNKT